MENNLTKILEKEKKTPAKSEEFWAKKNELDKEIQALEQGEALNNLFEDEEVRPRLSKKFSKEELNAHKDTLVTAWPGDFTSTSLDEPNQEDIKVTHSLEKEKPDVYPASDEVLGPKLPDFMLMNTQPKPKPWMIKKH